MKYTSNRFALLIDPLEGRDTFAFIFVERSVDDLAVLEDDIGRVWVWLEAKRVLHPSLVVTL